MLEEGSTAVLHSKASADGEENCAGNGADDADRVGDADGADDALAAVDADKVVDAGAGEAGSCLAGGSHDDTFVSGL